MKLNKFLEIDLLPQIKIIKNILLNSRKLISKSHLNKDNYFNRIRTNLIKKIKKMLPKILKTIKLINFPIIQSIYENILFKYSLLLFLLSINQNLIIFINKNLI